MNKRYKILFIITTVITSLAVLIIYLAFDKYFNDVYKNNTELAILESKRDFLKYTVENQISRIEDEIRYERECFEKRRDEIALALQTPPTSKRQDLIAFVVDISKTMSTKCVDLCSVGQKNIGASL